MTPSATATIPRDLSAQLRLPWFALIAIGLCWVEIISRLRLEWEINPQYGYGWTVPFLAAYIFWRKSRAAPESSPPNRALKILSGAALALCAVALIPLRIIQEANPDWRLLSWAMALAVVAITLSALFWSGGARWTVHFAFPVLFFLVAVPWPTQMEQWLIQGLMRADAAINVEFLNLIGIPAVQLGNVIEVGTGFVGINDACTGVRSLQATFMVSLFLGALYEFSVARRILLVAAGAILAFTCNLIRTFLLVYLGAEHGSGMIKSWHDPAGLSILFICMFALWGLSLFLRSETPPAPNEFSPRAAPIPRVVLAWLLLCVVTAEASTQLWYRSREASRGKETQWAVEWPRQNARYQTVPVAEEAQELLRYNEGGGASWAGATGHRWNMFFFRWLPGRTAGLFIKNHRPDICLPASGMTQRGGAQYKLLEANGVTLPIRAYVFENGGQLLHVYYCYWDGSIPKPAMMNEENWTPSGRLEAVRNGKRDVGTQMLELAVWGIDDDAAAEQALRAQLRELIRPG
jgi:exosortase